MNRRIPLGFALTLAGVLFSSLPSIADTHYVSPSGGHTAPFTNWPSAATNIQAAIDAAWSNDVVLVTNGVYDTGGVVVEGDSTMNRIAVTNVLTVQSVNGPEETLIVGNGPLGSNAVRCAYLADEAELIGFTLTNGHTASTESLRLEEYGGGARCETNALLAGCTIRGNRASSYGGGIYGGVASNCTIAENVAGRGGGTYETSTHACLIKGNDALSVGGGTYSGDHRGSTIVGNTATNLFGGGSYYGTFGSCTIVSNAAYYGAGGVGNATLLNSIVWGNVRTGSGGGGSDLSSCIADYTCSRSIPQGSVGHISDDPQFVDADALDFRLQSTSPCIDAGTNLAWMAGAVDLDGLPRIINGTVDMGAYESPSPAVTSITVPSPGAVITWASFTGAQYAVYGSTNLVHGYDLLLQAEIDAQPPLNAFTDTVDGVILRGYAVEYTP